MWRMTPRNVNFEENRMLGHRCLRPEHRRGAGSERGPGSEARRVGLCDEIGTFEPRHLEEVVERMGRTPFGVRWIAGNKEDSNMSELRSRMMVRDALVRGRCDGCLTRKSN